MNKHIPFPLAPVFRAKVEGGSGGQLVMNPLMLARARKKK